MIEPIIVENSARASAIGDTIAAFPALAAFAWRQTEPVEVYLACAVCRPLLPDHAKICQLTERPTRGVVLDIQEIAQRHLRSGASMSQGYMEAIGLPDVARVKIPEISIEIGEQPETMQQFDVLLAPFSHSDFGTNTKIWPKENWVTLIMALRQEGLAVGLLGTTQDLHEWEFWQEQPVKNIIDYPLQEVGHLMLKSKVVISTDNGINWMAQALKVRHIVLLPQTSHPNWSGNLAGNGFNLPITADSATVIAAARGAIAHAKQK